MLNYHLTINDQDGERTAVLKTTEFREACKAQVNPAPVPTIFQGSAEQGRRWRWSVSLVPFQAAAAHPHAGLSRQEWALNVYFSSRHSGKREWVLLSPCYPHMEKFLQPDLHLATQGSVLCADGTSQPGELEPSCQQKQCFPQALFAPEACGIWVGTHKENLLNYIPVQVQSSSHSYRWPSL